MHYPMGTLFLNNCAAYFHFLFYIPLQRTNCHDPSEWLAVERYFDELWLDL